MTNDDLYNDKIDRRDKRRTPLQWQWSNRAEHWETQGLIYFILAVLASDHEHSIGAWIFGILGFITYSLSQVYYHQARKGTADDEQ